MPLIQVVLILAVIGFLVWLITNYIPMAAPFKNAIVVIAVVAVLLFLLSLFGIGDITIGRIHH